MNAQPPTQPLNDPLAQPWEKNYCVGMHLTTLAAGVFVPVVPALIMWLVKRHDSPFIDDHGREVVNFQISLVLYGIIATIFTVATAGVGVVVSWPLVYILGLVGLIMGAVAAGHGRYFRYPACIRFIK